MTASKYYYYYYNYYIITVLQLQLQLLLLRLQLQLQLQLRLQLLLQLQLQFYYFTNLITISYLLITAYFVTGLGLGFKLDIFNIIKKEFIYRKYNLMLNTNNKIKEFGLC